MPFACHEVFARRTVAGEMMGSLRRIVTAVACAGALAAGLVQPATAAGGGSAKAGFSPVRSSADVRTSVAAVGGGQVWVAGSTGDGQVRLEHLLRGRWWTTELPVKADEYTQISGSGPRDVWLVSGGELWHYTKNWRRVKLPKGEIATAVQDVPGKNVYVGTYRTAVSPQGYSDVIARLFRFNGNRWTSLGGPELPDEWQTTGTRFVERIVVNRGKVLAEVRRNPPSPMVIHDVYRVDAKVWTNIARTGDLGRQSEMRLAGWLSYPDQTQTFLGYAGMPNGESVSVYSLSCLQVTGDASTSCPPSQTAVSAAVLLTGGPAVLGGRDWAAYENNAWVNHQGTFVLRQRNGTERVLAGDPGDATVAMSADPAGSNVWAITREAGQYSIQRYRR